MFLYCLSFFEFVVADVFCLTRRNGGIQMCESTTRRPGRENKAKETAVHVLPMNRSCFFSSLPRRLGLDCECISQCCAILNELDFYSITAFCLVNLCIYLSCKPRFSQGDIVKVFIQSYCFIISNVKCGRLASFSTEKYQLMRQLLMLIP